MLDSMTATIKRLVMEHNLRDYVEDDGRINLEALQELPPETFNSIAADINTLLEEDVVIAEDDEYMFSAEAMDFILSLQEELNEVNEVNATDLSVYEEGCGTDTVSDLFETDTDPVRLMIYHTFIQLRMLQINAFSVCILPDEFRPQYDFDMVHIDKKLAEMVALGILEKIQLESGSMIDSGSDGEYRIKHKNRMPEDLREAYKRLEKVLLPCEKLEAAMPLELRKVYSKKVNIINSPSEHGEMNEEIAGRLHQLSQLYKEAFDFYLELPPGMADHFAIEFGQAIESETEFENMRKSFYDLKHSYHLKAVEQARAAEEAKLHPVEKESLAHKITHLFSH